MDRLKAENWYWMARANSTRNGIKAERAIKIERFTLPVIIVYDRRADMDCGWTG